MVYIGVIFLRARRIFWMLKGARAYSGVHISGHFRWCISYVLHVQYGLGAWVWYTYTYFNYTWFEESKRTFIDIIQSSLIPINKLHFSPVSYFLFPISLTDSCLTCLICMTFIYPILPCSLLASWRYQAQHWPMREDEMRWDARLWYHDGQVTLPPMQYNTVITIQYPSL